MPDRPHVLIIRRRYLGDIALLGPVFTNLRRNWPAARITVLVERAYRDLPPLNSSVDATWEIPGSVGAWPNFIRQLRRAGFTHVLDFDNTDKTALITRLTGAGTRSKLHLENVAQHLASFYTDNAFIGSASYSSRSIQETYLSLLSVFHLSIVTRQNGFALRPSDLAELQQSLPAGHPRVLVHPGSRSKFRQWPAENFAAVCDHLQGELGARVILVGGPDDNAFLSEIQARAATTLWIYSPTPSLARFAALAAKCQVLLCHDSGPMHVAAAFATPVVALFGSQNATVWGPVGANHTVLQAPLPCEDCVAPTRCVREDSYRNYCVRRITPEAVRAAVGAVLARGAAPQP